MKKQAILIVAIVVCAIAAVAGALVVRNSLLGSTVAVVAAQPATAEDGATPAPTVATPTATPTATPAPPTATPTATAKPTATAAQSAAPPTAKPAASTAKPAATAAAPSATPVAPEQKVEVATPQPVANTHLASPGEVVASTNAQRQAAGLPALATFGEMQGAADLRATELVTSFSHTRPDGSTCFTALPGGYTMMAENIAMVPGRAEADYMLSLWMNSPGHRANILEAGFNGMAAGVYYDPGTDYTYAVQLFAQQGQAAPEQPAPEYTEIIEVPAEEAPAETEASEEPAE